MAAIERRVFVGTEVHIPFKNPFRFVFFRAILLKIIARPARIPFIFSTLSFSFFTRLVYALSYMFRMPGTLSQAVGTHLPHSFARLYLRRPL